MLEGANESTSKGSSTTLLRIPALRNVHTFTQGNTHLKQGGATQVALNTVAVFLNLRVEIMIQDTAKHWMYITHNPWPPRARISRSQQVAPCTFLEEELEGLDGNKTPRSPKLTSLVKSKTMRKDRSPCMPCTSFSLITREHHEPTGAIVKQAHPINYQSGSYQDALAFMESRSESKSATLQQQLCDSDTDVVRHEAIN
ncbi:hypothetical protein B0O80DRAFT_494262 [Mortierella sp. GBAus27b]|nr:hypothetical protein B0O80DRAFT_494262 [Mortierella sp. GBAus27b]